MRMLATLWIICAFIIIWAMAGYPAFLLLLDKVKKGHNLHKDYSYKPTVTVMAVAHNEEKVIWRKLENLINLDYPKDRYRILVTSDYSTDRTNELVEKFIAEHPDDDVRLYKTVHHRGKTNAQNEAQKTVDTELLVMTDANCYFKQNAVKEIAADFVDEEIAYACGSTIFVNSDENDTAEMESTYWNMDSRCRDIESRIQTITAGVGNLYACRTAQYIDIPLIESHDSTFPLLFALKGYRAVFDPSAVAYEKAGESNQDEYKRKVRMNRNILHNILPSLRILNIIRYRWYTVFYLGHRTCRYLLWLAHLLLLILSFILAPRGVFWMIMLIGQLAFYALALIGQFTRTENRYIHLITYYAMTVAAQWHGVFNIITGKAKPTWSKAESTR
ncbi:MAG: glycosyltransferase [Oscillospiraceae bacterium]|nr:glycosyltransferase [Oscillospiraceae bacterium]